MREYRYDAFVVRVTSTCVRRLRIYEFNLSDYSVQEARIEIELQTTIKHSGHAYVHI